ncbi:MAG: hypothetical protein WCS49_02595 [Bacilli bacterium]
MALKKAYCTHCHVGDEKDRIFEVNSDAEACFCPRCMTQYIPSIPIAAFESFIAKQINQADKNLFSAIDYYKSYVMYAHVLELDPNNIRALFGRLLALIYMSSLRKTHFQNVVLLLNEEKDIFRKTSNEKLYLGFLHRVCNALDEYYVLFRKKLITHHYFYDVDCIKLYFKNLSDIQKLRTFILKEYRFIQARHDEPDVKLAIASLEKSISSQSEEMNKKWLTADGYAYGFVGTSQSGDLLLGRSDIINTVKIARYRPKALLHERTNRKNKLINDQVFPNFLSLYRLEKVSLPTTIILFVLSIISLICTLTFLSTSFYQILVVVTCLLFTCATGFLFAYIFSLYRLVKRHRLIS